MEQHTKVRHPGTVIWEDYFKKDMVKVLSYLGQYTSNDHHLKFFRVLAGSGTLEGYRYTLSVFFNVLLSEIAKLQEDYEESLKPKVDEEAIYKLIAEKFKDLTGINRDWWLFQWALRDKCRPTLIESNELTIAVSKILNKWVLDWVKEQFEALKAEEIKRQEVLNFTCANSSFRKELRQQKQAIDRMDRVCNCNRGMGHPFLMPSPKCFACGKPRL